MGFLYTILLIVIMILGFRGIALLFVAPDKELITASILAVVLVLIIPIIITIFYLIDEATKENLEFWVKVFIRYFQILAVIWIPGMIIFLIKRYK